MPTKPNRAGEQQPYIEAGHGEASGEYGDKATGGNVHIKITEKDEPIKTVEPTKTVAPYTASKQKEFIGNYIKEHSKFEAQRQELIQSMINEADDKINNIIAKALEKGNYLFETGRSSYYSRWGIALASSDLEDETSRVKGETLYHEIGHLVDWQDMARWENVPDFIGRTYSGGFVSPKFGVTLQEMITNEGREFARDAEKVRKIKEIKLAYQQEELKKLGISQSEIETIENNHAQYIKEKEEIVDAYYKQRRDLSDKYYNDEIPEAEYSNQLNVANNQYGANIKNVANKWEASENEYSRFLSKKSIANMKGTDRFLQKYSSLSDVYSGATVGQDSFGMSHSSRYWRESKYHKGNEFFAETFQAKANGKEQYEVLKQYFPKSVEIVDEILEEMSK